MRLHFIMHESFESPAAIEEWARKKNHEITHSRIYQGDRLPQNSDNFDFLVIMGGPQSPATTKMECAYYDAKAEIQLIKHSIDARKRILGVCLGAQLIGEAFSAPFAHSPHREIGVFDIKLTPAAAADPIFSQFPRSFPVAHWHGDMPGLSKDAVVLAYSEGCPRQVVRYTPYVYGFQCHFEFNQDAVGAMIESCGHELESYRGHPFIESAEALKNHDYDSMNDLLFRFLDYMEGNS